MEFERLIHRRDDREVRKKVITTGDYDVVPYEDAKCALVVSDVRCHDGTGKECALGAPSTLLESGNESNHVSWTVGAAENGLDRDLDLALQQMCRGERCTVTLVYRSLRNEVVREISCEMYLQHVEEVPPVADWPWERLLAVAERHKERGVVLVKQSRLIDAFVLFGKALKLAVALEPLHLSDVPEEERPRLLDLKVKLYNNVAHCQLEAQQWAAAAAAAGRALTLRPADAKALYRRGAARAALGLHEEAWADLTAAVRARPHDNVARAARDRLEPTVRRINQDYTDLIRKMFS